MKLTVLAVATATLIAASPVAFAQGVSSNAPGHKTKNYKGSPGASYWAPGHKCSAMRGARSLVLARPAMLRDVRPPDMGRNISRAGSVADCRLAEAAFRIFKSPNSAMAELSLNYFTVSRVRCGCQGRVSLSFC